MTRTRTPRKAAPRTRALPAEIRTLVPGHARGDVAFIAIRRKGALWAVVDNNRGDWTPDYWDGRAWKPLDGDAETADVYRWSQEQARELADRFAAQAAEIEPHYIGLMDQVQRIEALATDGPVVDEGPVTLPEVEAAVEAAEAEVRVRSLQDAVGVSVPAPKDVPGFGVSSQTLAATVHDKALPDIAEDGEDPEFLTGLGRSIPAEKAKAQDDGEEAEEADAEKTTVVSTAEVRELTGNGETQEMPTLPAEMAAPEPPHPPMPNVPPQLEPVPRVDWGTGQAAKAPALTT